MIPHITEEQFDAFDETANPYLRELVNRRIDAKNAEAEQPKPAEPFDLSKIKGVGRDFEPAAPTCQVQLIGGEVQTMTREAAKALQAATRDTHDWFNQEKNLCGEHIGFERSGAYSYKPKVKKEVSWSQMPVGVMTSKGELRATYIDHDDILCVDVENTFLVNHGISQRVFYAEHLTLAPASEQPWLNWRGGECPVPEGVIVEVTYRSGAQQQRLEGIAHAWKHYHNNGDIIEYRIVGVESGYELGGN